MSESSDNEDNFLAPEVPTKKKGPGKASGKAPPFTTYEKSFLLELVQEKKATIESKASDPKAILKKQKAWEKIAEEFCCNENVNKRSVLQLKRAWENAKTRAKNEVINSF